LFGNVYQSLCHKRPIHWPSYNPEQGKPLPYKREQHYGYSYENNGIPRGKSAGRPGAMTSETMPRLAGINAQQLSRIRKQLR
jgi:hypothetical protein